jgi:DNA-binding GntR family transcriptional regulator
VPAREHLDIIDAVIAGHPAEAEQLTRDHFASVIEALRQLANANPSPVSPLASLAMIAGH